MSWEAELEELRRRQRLARELGGAERVKRHKDGGKLTVRERIDGLLDPGSFREIGSIAGKAEYDDGGNITGFTPAYLVMGQGMLDGRPVVVAGDDFTVRGGSAEGGLRDKLVRAEMMARDLRLPIVRLADGTGGGGSVRALEVDGYAKCPALYGWGVAIENLSLVPVVGLALGSTAGFGAARVATSHYSVMVKDTSQLFIAGPPVVNRLGPRYEKNELGGSDIHTRNGTVDDEVETEAEAFARTKRFLSYVPRSVYELPARVDTGDDPLRKVEWLIEAIPRDERQVYKMRDIVEAVADQGSFFEMGRRWGRPVITGFARFNGWPVALLASDPYHYGGAWTADAARKIRRFVDLAQTFHFPVVHLVDVPGFMVGLEAEQAATMRHAADAIAAIIGSKVPWCAVIVRKCFGIGGGAHANNSRYSTRYAWPSANWGSMPIAGGLEASYRSEIAQAPDPQAKLAEIEARLARVCSPFRTAVFWISPMMHANVIAKLRATLQIAGVALFAVGTATAQNYPARPIRSIVPFPAGGAADLVSRIFAQQLSDDLGQQVVVDNRGGASGIIGLVIAAKAAPDGYTLIQAGSTNFAIGPALTADLPYDPVKDFTPIALLASAPNSLSGHPSVPAQSIQELIALAKARPGQITFASPGTGTTSHIFGELFIHMAGVKLLHIPYKGGGPAFVDLLGGHVQLLFGALSTSLPSIKAGKLRGYGVTSSKRSPVAPDLPTIAEAGVPGYEALQWFGIAAPAGTAGAIIVKLNGAFVAMLQTQVMKDRLLHAGLEAAAPNKPAEFAAYIRKEVATWGKVAKDAGIRVQLAK